jgi:hypothetical protein
VKKRRLSIEYPLNKKIPAWAAAANRRTRNICREVREGARFRRGSIYHEAPSAAAPQPNRQEDVHHEGHENHEVRSLKYPKPFVSFVNFVVRPYFLIEHSNIGTVARKFAQAA